MNGKKFVSELVESVFNLLDLGAAGDGFPVGIVPELLLVDASEALETRLGKDAVIDAKKALNIHLEINHKISGERFRKLIILVLLTLLNQNVNRFQ